MPRVPTYDGPQVRANAVQPVYQNPEQFTAGLRTLDRAAQGLENVGQAFDQIATREAQRQAYDVESKIRADYLTFEQNARKTRQGANAKGLTDEVDQWWAKAAETYGKDLPPMARQLASRSLANARLQALSGAGSFENQQLDIAHDQSWAASKQTSISSALQNPAPEALAATVEELRRRNTEQAVRRGWAPEVLAAEMLKDTTALHTGVLDRLLASDQAGAAETAKAYYLKHQGEISGAVHDDIDKRLAQAGKAEVVQKNAIDIAGKFNYTQSEQALAAIDALSVPADVKTAIRQDVLQRHSIQLADSQQRHAKATKDLYSAVAAGANLQQLQKLPQWRELNDDGLALITMMEQRAAVREQRLAAAEGRQAAAESRAETRILRAERQQERATMAAAMRYSDPDVLQSMTRPQVEALLPVLGADHTQRLLAKKDAFTKSPEKLIEARIDKQDFDHIAGQMGLKPFDTSKSESQRLALGELQYRVETLINARQVKEKRPLAREEKMELMRTELARTVMVDPGFFSSNKQVPVIQLSAKDLEGVIVPPREQLLIEQALKIEGREITPENIRRRYLLGTSRDAAKLIPEPPKK